MCGVATRPSRKAIFSPFRRMLWASLAAIVLISAARMLSIEMGWFDYNLGVVYMRPWFRFDSILAGCCLALARSTNRAAIEKIGRLVSHIPLTLLWGALLCWTAWGGTPSSAWYLTVQMLGCTLALVQLLTAETFALRALFQNAPIRHVGRISYGLYLWQQLFTANPAARWGFLQQPPLNIFAGLTIAELSYHFVERPFLLLKDKLRYSGEVTAQATAVQQ